MVVSNYGAAVYLGQRAFEAQVLQRFKVVGVTKTRRERAQEENKKKNREGING